MARHNREGLGSDQRGIEYCVSYQPDWLRLVKVARVLESGRQSTRILFRNPDQTVATPGPRIRTMITSPAQGLDFGVAISDPEGVVRRVIIETVAPDAAADGPGEAIIFTLESASAPPEPSDSPEE